MFKISPLLKSSKGAVDLGSIMVGVVVVGVFSGIITATVMVVIPWAQDNAAKQALSSMAIAQQSYYHAYDTYTNFNKLVEKSLMQPSVNLCSDTVDGKSFVSASRSQTGKIFTSSSVDISKITLTNSIEGTCLSGTPPTEVAAGGDIVFNLNCSTATSPFYLPVQGFIGEAVWSDGVKKAYTGQVGNNVSRADLIMGQNYVVTLKGTFPSMNYQAVEPNKSASCLTGVPKWDPTTGTTNANYGFAGAIKLTDIPPNIPASVTTVEGLFLDNSTLNDADLTAWDTSNITNMKSLFKNAVKFNRYIGAWKTFNSTNMASMFENAQIFNNGTATTVWNTTPLNWDTSKVTDMNHMFSYALWFDHPMTSWNTSNVTDMSFMFSHADGFGRNLNHFNTSKVVTMEGMFEYVAGYNQPLNSWDVSNVTNMATMFKAASYFNQNIGMWNISKVTTTSNMFYEAHDFNNGENSDIRNWNTLNIVDMSGMFEAAHMFNQPIGIWNVSNVKNFRHTFYLDMEFNQNISAWNVSTAENMEGMLAYTKFFNQPLNTWNVSNVTNMKEMFFHAASFNQNLRPWNVAKVTQKDNFRTGSLLTSDNAPVGF